MFSVAPASAEVRIDNGAAAVVAAVTVKVYAFSTVCTGLLLSRTSVVTEKDPAAVGVPEIMPPVVSAKPLGNWPEAVLQV
jgi:hypothetical protein